MSAAIVLIVEHPTVETNQLLAGFIGAGLNVVLPDAQWAVEFVGPNNRTLRYHKGDDDLYEVLPV